MGLVNRIPFYPLCAMLFAASALLAWLLTFAARAVAARYGVMARRDLRRRHERDTPLLGGTGFFVVLAGMTLSAWLLPSSIVGTGLSARFAICFLSALTLIYTVGVIDDVVELKAPPKFLAQVAAAVLILFADPELPPMLDQFALPHWVLAPALVLWVVGITNAMNMIDGLDGLCSGVVGLSAVTLLAIMASLGMHSSFSICIAAGLAGCCVGFLAHNFNPAKIFLGDSGSMVLGFVLAVVSMKVEAKRSVFVSLSMPLFVLGIPLLDIGLSMVRRKRHRRSMFKGDRSHIHHRLQQVGLSHRSAVLLLWAASAYLDLLAYFLAQVPAAQSVYIYASVVPTLVFWLVGLYFLETRLSYQAARFSHLFLRQENHLFATRDQLVALVRAHAYRAERDGIPFTVIVLNSGEFLKHMAHERPARVIEFYMNLYAIFRSRLRESDLVGKLDDETIVAVLAGAGGSDGSDASIIDFLSTRVRALQVSYNIFQSHSRRPEGFRSFIFPKDAKQVWSLLGAREPDAEQALKRSA